MALESKAEEQILRNRIRELADKAFRQNVFTFTSFLGLGEQAIFRKMEREVRYAGYTLSGGTEGAQRQVIRFGSVEQLGYETEFPIACIRVRPLNARFADDLSHRDFLGALMNLGTSRSVIGDIRVTDGGAYVFCLDSVAEYICDNLEQVRHTRVSCAVVEDCGELSREEPERCLIQVASPRIDAVLAKVYRQSRNDCQELFRTGRVFVDGRLCENPARSLKAGETVNARGFGKFVVSGEAGQTRKGRLCMEVAVYR